MTAPAPVATTLVIGHHSYDIAHRALVMGVLVVGPGGGRHSRASGSRDALGDQAGQFVAEGADLLELEWTAGPERPTGPSSEELDHVAAAVTELVNRFDVPISVRTGRSSVAQAAFAAGAAMGNDSTGFADPHYLAVAAASGASVVAGHPGREAANALGAGADPNNSNGFDVVERVSTVLEDRAARALTAGIAPTRVIVDPGLNRSPTAAQSLELLRASGRLAGLGYPLLLSPAARGRGFLDLVLDLDDDQARPAMVAVHALGAALGCRVLRTSDVRSTGRARDMVAAILEAR